MRKSTWYRLAAFLLAVVCCVPAWSALADVTPVLYKATATAATKIYQNADANARVLATIPKNGSLFVVSSVIVENKYIVLYNTTRGYAPAETIQLDAESVKENDASIYTPVAYGDERAEVITLQEALKELGYYTGAADGIFGAGTRKAVLAYQKANGLEQSGAADAATQKKLYEQKSVNQKGKTVQSSIASSSLDYTLSTGHTGYAVKQLQQALKDQGYYSKTIDGQYGASTASAVKAFQKKNKLKQTGKADAATLRLLFNAPAAKQTLAAPSPTATAQPGKASAALLTTYTTASVNMRKAASTSSTRLLTVPKGATIEVLSISSSFVKATYKNKTGYLAVDYVFLPPEYLPGKTLASSTEAQQHFVTLYSGMTGKEVGILQQALKELGFFAGTVNSSYGESTVTAVKAFQKKNGLKQDGIASPELQQLLLEGRPLNAKGKKTDVNVLPLIADIDLRPGDTGEQVTRLQHQLITVGAYTGKPTGVFDSATEKAVRKFQQDHSLYVDGVVGKKTRTLLDLLAATPTPAPTLTPTPAPKGAKAAAPKKAATPAPTYPAISSKNVQVLKKGSFGEAVKFAQLRLAELGYYSGEIDGLYDEEEIVAVQEFQRVNGLKVDGVAGLSTQQKLYAATAKSASPLPRPTATPEITPAPVSGKSTVSPAAGNEVLQLGSTGANVKALQQRLSALGYYTGRIDGDFGTGTALAVTSFQLRNKLSPDGVAGAKTLNKLYSSSALSAAGKQTATPAPTAAAVTALQSGDKGAQVKSMQQRLVELGYLNAADGIYGIATYNAVVAFQKRNGLSADGIAGKMTLNRLNSSSAVPAAGLVQATPKPAAAASSSGAAFTAPSASEVRNANWYSEIRSRAKLMPTVVIYDPDTGLHFNFHMFSFGKHADGETPTAADTAVLNRVCGNNSWSPKYVWVIFTDGRVYIGSIHSHGHSVDHTSGNDLEGHVCLHFPRVMTEAEATGPYAVSHQKEILYGWEVTQAMAK